MARLYMQGYPALRICLIMAPYASIMPEYGSGWLSVPQ